MEEMNSHRNDEDPGRNETNECDAFPGEVNFSDGLTKGNGKVAAGTIL